MSNSKKLKPPLQLVICPLIIICPDNNVLKKHS